MTNSPESGNSKKMELVSQVSSGPRRPRKYPPATSAVRGWMQLWNDRESIPFQSSIERDLLIMCGALKEVRDVSWEPLTISFKDHASSTTRTYTPDFLITIENNTEGLVSLLVETKRRADLKRKKPVLESCFAAAEVWAKSRANTRFALIDDEWMTNAGLENLRMIHAFRRTKYTPAMKEKIVNDLERKSKLTVGSVLRQLTPETTNMNSAMAILMSMVWDREVRFQLDQPLEMESTITRGAISNPFSEFFIR